MAQYTVNYSCGHTGTVNLFGPGRDRERKIEWLEKSGSCPECDQQQQNQQRQDWFDEMAAQPPADDELPQLVGSEKQVVWARKIRAEAITNAKAGIANKEKAIEGRTFSAEDQKIVGQWRKYSAEAISDLESQTSAKWWIENGEKYQLSYDVKNRMQKEMEKK